MSRSVSVHGWWEMRRRLTILGAAWGAAGVAFALFGALNFFTHIGLIVNTQ